MPKFIARISWKCCKVFSLLQVSLFLLSGFSTLFSHVGLVSKPVGVSTWTQMCRPQAVGEGTVQGLGWCLKDRRPKTGWAG